MRVGALLAALSVVGSVAVAPPVSAAPADTRPTAVVWLEDSAISGEGAGSYEPGTEGEGGNWCHRSTRAASPAGEWQRRITVDPEALVHGGLDAIGIHLARQQSFHPNADGHAQLGRCVTEFVRGGTTTARCLQGTDGYLHAVP